MAHVELWEVERVHPDMLVAEVEAPTMEQAKREIMHYAMMYSGDGPVQIRYENVRDFMEAHPSSAPNPEPPQAE